jgi:hypothetical protein
LTGNPGQGRYPPQPAHLRRHTGQPHRDPPLFRLRPQRGERAQAGHVDEGQPADVYHDAAEAAGKEFIETGGKPRFATISDSPGLADGPPRRTSTLIVVAISPLSVSVRAQGLGASTKD